MVGFERDEGKGFQGLEEKNLGKMVGSGPWGIGGMVFWEDGGKGL